jgi:hypothetical protein
MSSVFCGNYGIGAVKGLTVTPRRRQLEQRSRLVAARSQTGSPDNSAKPRPVIIWSCPQCRHVIQTSAFAFRKSQVSRNRLWFTEQHVRDRLGCRKDGLATAKCRANDGREQNCCCLRKQSSPSNKILLQGSDI